MSDMMLPPLPLRMHSSMLLFQPGHLAFESLKRDYLEEMALERHRPSGAGMFCFSPSDVDASRAYLVGRASATGAIEFLAGMQVQPKGDDAEFKGVLVAHASRGLGIGHAMIAEVRALELQRDPRRSHTAWVRIYRDGSINRLSYRALRQAGFDLHSVSSFCITVPPTARDAHLLASAEPGGVIRALRLRADP